MEKQTKRNEINFSRQLFYFVCLLCAKRNRQFYALNGTHGWHFRVLFSFRVNSFRCSPRRSLFVSIYREEAQLICCAVMVVHEAPEHNESTYFYLSAQVCALKVNDEA